MARSGSTLIQTLFAQDPANIAPQFWEVMLPSPPPRFGIGAERKARVAQMMKWHLDATPGFTTRHPYFIEDNYQALAECGSIGQMSFAGYQFFSFFPVPSYQDWFVKANHRHAIRFHRYLLQHLQWGREGRAWVSKAVEHGVYLDALIEEYPDAIFVWTHRDPYEQLASMSSTAAVLRQLSSRIEDLRELGRLRVKSVKETFDRTMAARRKADPKRFFDVYYLDLLHRPIETVRTIYDAIGRPLTAEAELRMENWLHHNAQDKHGTHVYDPAEYGLDRSDIQRVFGDYLSQHGAELQASQERNRR
jgi:hypothetical protein